VRCPVNVALSVGLCGLRELLEKLEQGIEGTLEIFKRQSLVVSLSPKLEGKRMPLLVQCGEKMGPFLDKDHRGIIRNIVK
jgi:hypothetical protein